MADEKQYVRTDEHGVMRVGRTHVMLDSVVAGWQQGVSPESIRRDYPSLTLEEVYGAITWCLAHPEELKVYLEKQRLVWEQWKARVEQDEKPVVKRLRALKAAQTKG